MSDNHSDHDKWQHEMKSDLEAKPVQKVLRNLLLGSYISNHSLLDKRRQKAIKIFNLEAPVHKDSFILSLLFTCVAPVIMLFASVGLSLTEELPKYTIGAFAIAIAVLIIICMSVAEIKKQLLQQPGETVNFNGLRCRFSSYYVVFNIAFMAFTYAASMAAMMAMASFGLSVDSGALFVFLFVIGISILIIFHIILYNRKIPDDENFHAFQWIESGIFPLAIPGGIIAYLFDGKIHMAGVIALFVGLLIGSVGLLKMRRILDYKNISTLKQAVSGICITIPCGALYLYGEGLYSTIGIIGALAGFFMGIVGLTKLILLLMEKIIARHEIIE